MPKTQFSTYDYATSVKWLELLKEIAPRVKQSAVLRDATIASGRPATVDLLWNPRFASAESRLERLLTLRAVALNVLIQAAREQSQQLPVFPYGRNRFRRKRVRWSAVVSLPSGSSPW